LSRNIEAQRTRVEEGADSLFGHSATTRWGLGYHLYPFEATSAAAAAADDAAPQATDRPPPPPESAAMAAAAAGAGAAAAAAATAGGGSCAFGHAGVGGSLALADPERGIALAITVNNLTSSRQLARRVVSCVAETLQLGGRYTDFVS
jgi:CubicO group peptidase (beta-lactamase class C family)